MSRTYSKIPKQLIRDNCNFYYRIYLQQTLPLVYSEVLFGIFVQIFFFFQKSSCSLQIRYNSKPRPHKMGRFSRRTFISIKRHIRKVKKLLVLNSLAFRCTDAILLFIYHNNDLKNHIGKLLNSKIILMFIFEGFI